MPCNIIFLRRDQLLKQRLSNLSSEVTIFAPYWVKEGLRLLAKHLVGLTFDVQESRQGWDDHRPVERFKITEFNQHSLHTLQRVARNESSNTNGVIRANLYPDIKDRSVLYALQDLVRQCIVVGVDYSSKCGGFKCPKEEQRGERVYVVDLAALQFQQKYNSGRQVLVQKEQEERATSSCLDDFIFEHVVGEKKRTFEQVSAILLQPEQNGELPLKSRYVPNYHNDSIISFFDKKAYCSFVKQDFILSAVGVAKMAQTFHPEDKVVFKFLKYGTGFFGGVYSSQLDSLILSAVLDGVEEVLNKHPDTSNVIRAVELPFYHSDADSNQRIERIRNSFGVNVTLSRKHALKKNDLGLKVATTNCGDNHAMCGNEMGFSSVDASIAENLESKGNIFSANINLLMNEYFLCI